jgi:hypothetical protein
MAGMRVDVGEKRKLDALIDRLGRGTTGAVLKSILRDAVPPLVARAKGLAPVRWGYLGRSMVNVERWYPRRKVAVSVVGPASEREYNHRGKPIKPAKYGHFAEAGTAPHSLESAVDMKAIRRGQSVFVDMAVRELRGRGVKDPWVNERQVRGTARGLARDYIYRRDARSGKRTHPGAKPTRFLQRATAETETAVQARVNAGVLAMLQAVA